MLQIRTEINGELRYLDLYKDEDIKLEISFNEVQNITSKNSPFSKSFKLPGSHTNNDVFNHFYRTDSSTFDFNPQQKLVSQLVYNGYELYAGYLRLNNVTRQEDDIIYDVTFYSQVGDLVSNIQEKYLSDLQLYKTDPNEYTYSGYPVNLEFQYNRNRDPELNSVRKNSSNPVDNGKLYFPLLNRGYQYTTNELTDTQEVNAGVIPRLRFQQPPSTNVGIEYLNYFDSDRFIPPAGIPARHVPRTYLTGSLRVKDIYEAIFRENGYTIESSFFDTAYFQRYYMPLTVSNDGLYPIQSTKPQFEFLTSGATSATSVTYACTNYDWYELPGTSSIKSNRFDTSNVIVDNDNFWSYNDSFFTRRNGTYRVRLTYNVWADDTGTYTFNIRNKVYQFPTPPYSTCWASGTTVASTPPLSAATGDYLEDQVVELQFDNWYDEERWYALDFKLNNLSDDIRITKMKMEVIEAPHFITGTTATYDPLKELVSPDIKQLEFISSINKIFNLLVIPDNENVNNLIVEPVIDWIGKGETIDWNGKVDRSAPITIEPLTNIINGTLDYTYKEDSSSTNVDFKKLNNRNFGQNIVRTDTDYRDNVTTFSNIFAGQIDNTLNTVTSINGLTLPAYYTTETEDKDGQTFIQFKPYKSPPKLLFRQPPIPILSYRPSAGNTHWFSIDNYKQFNWVSNNRYTTYPYGVSGLTHAAVWNKNDYFDPNEYNLSGYEDLYDVYYKDYILDLLNEDNRIIRAEVILTPEEVRNLRFNEKIYLDGSYYRINKISDLNLTKKDRSKVELIKITREYTPHRVRYYDLINCTGGTDLHTSTDIQYSVYYLKDYNVSISGICYTVTAGEYNSGYTYQFVDLYDAYTDCGCSISIDDVGLDPYDEDFPAPTPSPTPDICGGCTYYEWENENPYSVSVTYRDCDTLSLITDSIGASQIYTACTCNNYGYSSSGSLRVNFTEPCFASTPTPTPSVTPTITPTVSFTPTSTTTPQPTPTVTRTQTNTPTPTPSYEPSPFSYEVVNCDDGGDVRCVGSANFIAVNKVVKLQGLVDKCFIVVGPCVTPQVGQVDSEYTDCGSCPR